MEEWHFLIFQPRELQFDKHRWTFYFGLQDFTLGKPEFARSFSRPKFPLLQKSIIVHDNNGYCKML